jgi:hypothetical protein
MFRAFLRYDGARRKVNPAGRNLKPLSSRSFARRAYVPHASACLRGGRCASGGEHGLPTGSNCRSDHFFGGTGISERFAIRLRGSRARPKSKRSRQMTLMECHLLMQNEKCYSAIRHRDYRRRN